mmetsp:Transcript_118304/g.342022  ORF Transcript_118304/g.342022 Transcript_118304/m.342022 type:complete len:204 (-) Transcript_118304:228-839(-)
MFGWFGNLQFTLATAPAPLYPLHGPAMVPTSPCETRPLVPSKFTLLMTWSPTRKPPGKDPSSEYGENAFACGVAPPAEDISEPSMVNGGGGCFFDEEAKPPPACGAVCHTCCCAYAGDCAYKGDRGACGDSWVRCAHRRLSPGSVLHSEIHPSWGYEIFPRTRLLSRSQWTCKTSTTCPSGNSAMMSPRCCVGPTAVSSTTIL